MNLTIENGHMLPSGQSLPQHSHPPSWQLRQDRVGSFPRSSQWTVHHCRPEKIDLVDIWWVSLISGGSGWSGCLGRGGLVCCLQWLYWSWPCALRSVRLFLWCSTTLWWPIFLQLTWVLPQRFSILMQKNLTSIWIYTIIFRWIVAQACWRIPGSRGGRLGGRLEDFLFKSLRRVGDPSLPKLVASSLKKTIEVFGLDDRSMIRCL